MTERVLTVRELNRALDWDLPDEHAVSIAGLVIGFVLGVYLAELANRRDQRLAWTSTKHAVKGVALSVGVELFGALLATAAWVAGVYLTQ